MKAEQRKAIKEFELLSGKEVFIKVRGAEEKHSPVEAKYYPRPVAINRSKTLFVP